MDVLAVGLDAHVVDIADEVRVAEEIRVAIGRGRMKRPECIAVGAVPTFQLDGYGMKLRTDLACGVVRDRVQELVELSDTITVADTVAVNILDTLELLDTIAIAETVTANILARKKTRDAPNTAIAGTIDVRIVADIAISIALATLPAFRIALLNLVISLSMNKYIQSFEIVEDAVGHYVIIDGRPLFLPSTA